MAKVKAIVFDCFGVLTTDTWRDFLESLSTSSVDISALKSLNQAFGAGFISEKQFRKEVASITGHQPPMTEQSNKVMKNTQLLFYIAKLRKRGFRIGLLSNISSNWIRESFLTQEEQDLFDEMILSYELGITKPNLRIFEIACEKLGVATDEAIMVDDIQRYCEAARDAGMKAVVYTDFHQAKQQIEEQIAE